MVPAACKVLIKQSTPQGVAVLNYRLYVSGRLSDLIYVEVNFLLLLKMVPPVCVEGKIQLDLSYNLKTVSNMWLIRLVTAAQALQMATSVLCQLSWLENIEKPKSRLIS